MPHLGDPEWVILPIWIEMPYMGDPEWIILPIWTEMPHLWDPEWVILTRVQLEERKLPYGLPKISNTPQNNTLLKVV